MSTNFWNSPLINITKESGDVKILLKNNNSSNNNINNKKEIIKELINLTYVDTEKSIEKTNNIIDLNDKYINIGDWE